MADRVDTQNSVSQWLGSTTDGKYNLVNNSGNVSTYPTIKKGGLNKLNVLNFRPEQNLKLDNGLKSEVYTIL